MTLEQKIRNGTLSRRDFNALLAIGGAGLLATACGGSKSPTAPGNVTPSPLISNQVTISAEVRNSNGDTLQNLEYKVDTGSNLVVSVPSLHEKGVNTSVLADGYLVARGPDGGGMVGPLIASTKNNQLQIPTTQNRQIVIYGLNNTNQADYAGAFTTPGYAERIPLGRDITIRKLPAGITLEDPRFITTDGPEEPILEALDWAQKAFTLNNGTKLINLTYVGNASDAKARVAWYKPVPGYGGAHGGSFYGVNQDYNTPNSSGLFLSEKYEMILGPHQNIKVNGITWTINAKPSPVGEDYARAGALFAP